MQNMKKPIEIPVSLFVFSHFNFMGPAPKMKNIFFAEITKADHQLSETFYFIKISYVLTGISFSTLSDVFCQVSFPAKTQLATAELSQSYPPIVRTFDQIFSIFFYVKSLKVKILKSTKSKAKKSLTKFEDLLQPYTQGQLASQLHMSHKIEPLKF